MNQDPTKEQIDRLIESALKEDLGSGDITTRGLIDDDRIWEAEVLARESLVVCGMDIFKAVFSRLDAGMNFPEEPFRDGEEVSSEAVLLRLRGRAVALLEGERVALNILQRLCGIATRTRQFVERAGAVEVLDTRKTTPGLRVFEKYAVRCGGGKNHRFGLFDAVLIKDNHIKAAGGIAPAVERMRGKYGPDQTIEVETTTQEEVKAALEAGADIIMLDNMSLEAIREATRLIDGKARIEVSGSVTLERLEGLSQSGIDCVSVGALTHSSAASDISMNFLKKSF